VVFFKVVKPCFFGKKDFFLTLVKFSDQTCLLTSVLFLKKGDGAVRIGSCPICAADRFTQLNGDSETAGIVEGGVIREPLENSSGLRLRFLPKTPRS
jgi:hypothetical protein